MGPWAWAAIAFIVLIVLGGVLLALAIFFTGRALPDPVVHRIGDISSGGLARNVVLGL